MRQANNRCDVILDHVIIFECFFDDILFFLDPVCDPVCLNGGTCVGQDACACSVGWQGTSCEIGIDKNRLLTMHGYNKYYTNTR